MTTADGFVRVSALSELHEDTPKHVEIGETSVCVVRTGGEVFAINDICSHAAVSLSQGEVEDGQIQCWLHGSGFDLRTGKPSGPPATRAIPVYPVQIEGDDVLVSITQEP